MAELTGLTGRIHPFFGKHAIEVMALAIEWSSPVDGDTLSESVTSFLQNSDLSARLPVVRRFPAFEVRIEDQSASVVQNNIEVVDFVQTNPDGSMAWTLSLRPEFFSCSCAAYTRWANVKPVLVELLKHVASIPAKKGARIGAIGLQYGDTFRWAKDDKDALSDLLRKDSGVFPANVLQYTNLWHSHNGWYSEDKVGNRVLNLVNLDLTDEGEQRALRVNGQHRLQSVRFSDNQPIEISLDEIEDVADALHIENKRALQSVLNDEVLSMIGMTKVEV